MPPAPWVIACFAGPRSLSLPAGQPFTVSRFVALSLLARSTADLQAFKHKLSIPQRSILVEGHTYVKPLRTLWVDRRAQE